MIGIERAHDLKGILVLERDLDGINWLEVGDYWDEGTRGVCVFGFASTRVQWVKSLSDRLDYTGV